MKISQRKFPYPYKAMLAISNDIDSFDIDLFRDIHREIRSDESMNIPLADSVWAFAAGAREGKQIAFFDMDKTQSIYAKELLFYCRKGLIDTLHTYGNFSSSEAVNVKFERSYAELALKFFKEKNIEFEVWVNHGDESNTQNVGRHKYMQGDVPGTEGYHADLMKQLGIKYVWDPKVRSVFSHNTMLKEIKLRDNSLAWSFSRFHALEVDSENREYLENRGCKFWGADKSEAIVWSPNLMDLSISVENLNNLIKDNGYSIVTQHIGYSVRMGRKLPAQAANAMRLLKKYSQNGDLIVATTSALLNYNRVQQFVRFEVSEAQGRIVINIKCIDDPVLGQSVPKPADVSGLCFYCPDPFKTFIAIDGTLVKSEFINRNPSDGFLPSIEISWNLANKPVDDVVSRFMINNPPKASTIMEKGSLPERNGMLEKRASVALWERAKVRSNKLSKRNCASLAGEINIAICVGGMKCGTTTLWSELSKVDGVIPCVVKEPSYFGQGRGEQQSLAEYLSLFPAPASNHRAITTFEASTHYAKYPKVTGVAEEIHRIAPKARIVYVARDPIDRIESQIAHHISRGEMGIEDFETGKWRGNNHLLNLSRYYYQISQYLKIFPREQIHLVQFEELVSSPSEVLTKLCSFIGVDHQFVTGKLDKVNPRRSDHGANRVALSYGDKAFLRQYLYDDISEIEKRFGIKKELWKNYFGQTV